MREMLDAKRGDREESHLPKCSEGVQAVLARRFIQIQFFAHSSTKSLVTKSFVKGDCSFVKFINVQLNGCRASGDCPLLHFVHKFFSYSAILEP